MKKIISTFIAVVCVAACLFTFAACDNGNETHTHNWSATYTNDGDRHYQTCDGCDEKNYSSHSYIDGVCVCGKQQSEQGETENPPTSELKAMSTYFNGLKVIENKTALYDGIESKTFEQVLDRQFSVLAQDILYRLYATYGKNTYVTNNGFGDITLSDGNYTYNGNPAKVVKSQILTDTDNHNNDITHSYGANGELSNIDCIYCYQYNINGNQTRMTLTRYIMIEEAISGNYHYWDGVIKMLDNTNATNYKWLYGEVDDVWLDNDNNGIIVTNNYLQSKWNTDYRTAFKYELAKIVYGDENTNLAYDELLAKINTTGFAAETEQKIIDTIYKKVIGENLVAEDLRIYNMFTEDDKSNIKRWTDESEIEKHYYKGYNITVPAIVKQALSNTFENTSVSLYPVVSRQNVTVSNSFEGISVSENTHSIVLMPKANAPVTKLVFEVSGTAGQSVTLNFNIVANSISKTVSKTVALTAATQTVEIDLAAAGVSKLGAYNGNTNSYTDTALFDNADGADTNGDNYISVDLANISAPFTIKFTGLYSK